jgi:hypothetical protein
MICIFYTIIVNILYIAINEKTKNDTCLFQYMINDEQYEGKNNIPICIYYDNMYHKLYDDARV